MGKRDSDDLGEFIEKNERKEEIFYGTEEENLGAENFSSEDDEFHDSLEELYTEIRDFFLREGLDNIAKNLLLSDVIDMFNE